MKWRMGLAITGLVCAVWADAALAETVVKVGWCARTISSAAAPFAIAKKMGWFQSEGIDVQLVPISGSGDCTKQVATGSVLSALASVEPVAIMRPLGVNIRVFYTAYQGNIYGIAVPRDSPVRTIRDLKGKKIGLIGMGSAGAIVARALAANQGMDPEKDITLVVAGEGAQTAAMVRSGQVDALSQYDTQYAMVESAGVPLRLLDTSEIDRYPSNGFLVLEGNMAKLHKELSAVGRGYAMGTVFAIANPEAAVRIVWDVFPQTKPTGKDEATALRDDVATLEARIVNWKLNKAGAKRWGENVEANYEAYMQFLLKWGAIKTSVAGKDVVTNAWIDEMNRFDANAIAAQAKSFKLQ